MRSREIHSTQLSHRLLSADEEQSLGRRIVDGERVMLEVLVATNVGLRSLGDARVKLQAGALPVERFLRNVSAHERSGARTRVVRLLGQLDRSRGRRRTVTRRLSTLRLHPDVLDGLEAAVATSTTTRSRLAVAAVRRMRRDIELAKHELVEKNLRLVVTVAARYQGFGLSLADLVQEGNIGLMLAVDKFDYRRGLRLSTYAVWWIRHVIQRALANQAPMIRLPVHLMDDRAKVLRTRRRLEHEGVDPSVEALAKASDVSASKVEMILSLVREPVSLDAPLSAESDAKLGDIVANDSSPHAEEIVQRMHDVRFALSLLDRLDARERRIIERRFGLDGEPPETLATIGRSMSLTRERIRQLEVSALDKLRSCARKRASAR